MKMSPKERYITRMYRLFIMGQFRTKQIRFC